MAKKTLQKEEWKLIESLKGMQLRKKYAVSSWGRVVAYKEKIEDGRQVANATVQGYKALKLKPYRGKENLSLFVHKIVAEHFVKKPGRSHIYVIHLDHEKLNNRAENLKWATKDEMFAHQQKSPAVIDYRKNRLHNPLIGHKLTAKDVIKIKKLVFDPKRKLRMRQIAEKFSISEMQLYRIKNGSNWSHIKV